MNTFISQPLQPNYWTPRDWIFAGLACVIPAILMLVWTIYNTEYPLSDAIDFLYSGLKDYEIFKNDGFFAGIQSLYNIRGWRPVIYHIFQTIYLLIFDGDMLLSSSAIMITCVGLTAVYAYALLRLALPPIQALLGAALVASSPIAQWQGGHFGFAESGMLPAVLASLYHLIRSDFFRVKKQCIYTVIALTLALTIRPVGSLFHLILPLTIILGVGLRRRVFTYKEVAAFITFVIIIFCALLLKGLVNKGMTYHSTIFLDEQRGVFYLKTFKITMVITALLVGSWLIYLLRLYSNQSLSRFNIKLLRTLGSQWRRFPGWAIRLRGAGCCPRLFLA